MRSIRYTLMLAWKTVSKFIVLIRFMRSIRYTEKMNEGKIEEIESINSLYAFNKIYHKHI